MQRFKYLVLTGVLAFYTFCFVATKKEPPCEGDCEKVINFNNAIRASRESYVVWSYRCGPNPVSDTLCIYVRDTVGINWNLLADTACTIAAQNGLLQQKIFILKNASSPVDTLARKACP